MTTWVIRATQYPSREALALREGVVTIGWPYTDDLDSFPSLQALTQSQQAGEPDRPAGRASNHAGQLWAFSRHVERGDLVILTRPGRLLALGEVTQPYQHRGAEHGEERHAIHVRWLDRNLSRDRIPPDLRRSFYKPGTVSRFGAAPDTNARLRALIRP